MGRRGKSRTTPISTGDYQYDVFLSYKRHELTDQWTVEVVKRLKFWLSQELNKAEASIFFDTTSIDVGDRWPDAIREAVKLSRCMVGIWSPMYFQSTWCVSEFKSFRAREDAVGVKIGGLIAPIKYHDGIHFPEEAKRIKWEDFSKHTSTVRGFWESPRALELEELITNFAQSVGKVVRNAPPFQPDWPIVEETGASPPTVPLGKLR